MFCVDLLRVRLCLVWFVLCGFGLYCGYVVCLFGWLVGLFDCVCLFACLFVCACCCLVVCLFVRAFVLLSWCVFG